jgi:flavin-dependent dehydrogenase
VRRAAALIVGGGPAGAAAAIRLAAAGRAPLLIERSEGPRDVVCGGFLGWDALAALGRLGLDASALGARPIARLRLVAGGRQVETALPKAAAGLSRRTLDEALLRKAGAGGAEILRGRSAKAGDCDRLSIRLDDGQEMEAEALFLATGKHELRGMARPRDTSGDPVGLRTALAGSPALQRALEGVIELHLFDGGYAGLLLQEDGSANLCLSVARRRLKRAGGIEELVAELAAELPTLRARLAEGQAGEWSAVSGVPYGWRATSTERGVYRIGDQGAVIASLAGDGIAIALESGMAAAEALVAARSAESYQTSFAGRAARPLAVAERLRWAAERRLPRAALMTVMKWAPGLAPLAARLTRIG